MICCTRVKSRVLTLCLALILPRASLDGRVSSTSPYFRFTFTHSLFLVSRFGEFLVRRDFNRVSRTGQFTGNEHRIRKSIEGVES
jgi:hypothetical protein